MKNNQEYSEIPYRVKEISFAVERFALAGDLLLPQADRQYPLIVFVWGSGAGGRHLIKKPSQLITAFIQAGYAVFIADKPGSGASMGDFSPNHLLHERAQILAQEVELLRSQVEVSSQQVGVYGSSQASYVMALTLELGAGYDFMIAVSCPAMDSVRQSAYLVKRQLLCAGYPLDEALRAERYYVQRDQAQDYQTYLEAARFLDQNPVTRDELQWGGILDKERFSPREADWEELYNPVGGFEKIKIPVLAVYGEKDTQVDPAQGQEAFHTLLEKNENRLSRVVSLPQTDHNMRLTSTGCLREQMEIYKRVGGADYNPEFLKILRAWLANLKDNWHEV